MFNAYHDTPQSRKCFETAASTATGSHMMAHQKRSFARRGDAGDTAHRLVRESTKIDGDRVGNGPFHEGNDAAIRVFADPGDQAFVLSRTPSFSVPLQVAA